MPELPEVETVRRGLEAVAHARVCKIEVLHERVNRYNAASDALMCVPHKILSEPFRRGKFLWFNLKESDCPAEKGGSALVFHLGMSGQILLNTGHDHPHTRLTMAVERNNECITVNYIDQRTFGFVQLSPLVCGIPLAISRVAPDVFDPHFDKEHVISVLSQRKAPIKNLLLQQHIISGVGNIYADESLWLSGIHPVSIARKIPQTKLVELLENIRTVMQASIDKGGTSFDNLYVTVNGQSGKFSSQLNVYGKTHQQCPRSKTPIQKIVVGGRGTHVSAYQKIYR